MKTLMSHLFSMATPFSTDMASKLLLLIPETFINIHKHPIDKNRSTTGGQSGPCQLNILHKAFTKFNIPKTFLATKHYLLRTMLH